MKALPGAGADMIESRYAGFSDPMADGPSVQASSQRSLKAGGSLARTLAQLRAFLERMTGARRSSLWGITTRSICMGWKKFLTDAIEAGADGLIVVDLHATEEDDELCSPTARRNMFLMGWQRRRRMMHACPRC